jgi:putative copper export protein/methionine-rich copper-binding protein CopC
VSAPDLSALGERIARRLARFSWFSMLAGALALLSLPAPALAHGHLKRSEPAAGAHLGAVPRELRLTFTEAPELAFTRVELLDPSGAAVALGPLAIAAGSRETVVAAVRGALAAGTYTVVWQMAGRDGHVTRGRFAFTIAPGARGTALGTSDSAHSVAPPAAPAPHHNPVSMPDGTGFGAESPLYVAVRWLQFVGLLVVIGAVAFALVVLRVLRRRRGADALATVARERTARIGLWATGLVAVAAFLRLLAQSYAMHGPARVLDAGLVGTMLTQTVWGWGWMLQAVAVVVALVGFRGAARGRDGGWTLAAAAALALAFTPALSGHAASAPHLAPLAVVADALHVVGASGWLGSLLLVLVVGVPVALRLAGGEQAAAVADLVNAYSPTALAFAGLVLATGVFAAWLHLGALSALWQSGYGKTLLLKLGVLSVVAATGAYNWRRVQPTLHAATGASGARRLRRSGSVELGVGLLVLVVTAVLVATPTAMDVAAMRTAAGQ